MTEIKELKDVLSRLTELQKVVKDSINTTLDTTKDLKGVKRISDNIVIVKSSSLNPNDFSAEYYMSNVQIVEIKKQLKNLDIVNIKKKIDEWVSKEKIQVTNNHKITLNPEVLKILKQLQLEFNVLE